MQRAQNLIEPVEGSVAYEGDNVRSCKRLWSAMLLIMIKDYANYKIKYPCGGYHLYDVVYQHGSGAESWLFHGNNSNAGSFEWVCEVLNLSYIRVRKALLADYSKFGGKQNGYYQKAFDTPGMGIIMHPDLDDLD